MKKIDQYKPLFMLLADENVPSSSDNKREIKSKRQKNDFYRVDSIELYPFYKNISTITSNYEHGE